MFFLRFIVMQEGIPLHLYKCIIGRKRGVAGILAESVTYYIKKLGCRGERPICSGIESSFGSILFEVDISFFIIF